jgi:ABC-2 type transport system permease protein
VEKFQLRSWSTLIAKDLRILMRDRVALLFLVLAPIVVISVAGFSLSTFYGGWERGETEYLFPVTDLDGSEISTEVVASLGEAEGLRLLQVNEREARRLVAETYQAGAALVIPEGFGSSFRRGAALDLKLLTDPVKYIEVLKIKAAVERVRSALVASHVAGRIAVVEVLTYAGDADFEAVAEDAAQLAERLVDQSVGLEEVSLTSSRARFNTFDQNVPGFGVTFLMLGMLMGVGLGLVDEREWGMIYRLSASPVSASALVTGKAVSRLFVGVLQMLILFAVGRVAFSVSLGRSWVVLGLVILGTSFAAATFGLLVAALAPSRDAVLPLGTIAVMGMAAVGGCWWPMSFEPQWLQSFAYVFPTAWAMEAFNDLMLRELGLADVWPSLLALVLFGLAYGAAGLRIFLRREVEAP